MEITRKDAVAVLTEVGYEEAEKLPEKKLQMKIDRLQTIAENNDKDPDDLSELALEVMAAEDVKIVVKLDDDEKEKKVEKDKGKKKSSGKKSKKAEEKPKAKKNKGKKAKAEKPKAKKAEKKAPAKKSKKAAPKKEKKTKPSKAKKPKTQTPPYTRTMAAVAVFKKSGKTTTAQKLAEQGDALYVKKGFESNMGVSKRATGYVVEVLAELNMITIEGKKITKV